MVVDNLIVAWGVHGESEVALQMSVANAEAHSFSFALVSWVKRLTGRARPYAAECETDPEYSSDCNSGRKYRSFYSGHATSTAVGAGLLCAHHLHLPLYGYPELDTGVCAAGIALTLTTCALRIASDNHWTSDVAVGHLVGFASGYLIPTLFFYRFDLLGKGGKPPERVWAPWLGPHSVGLRVWGGL
jgi:membrane-associated phospholipid phosphatase